MCISYYLMKPEPGNAVRIATLNARGLGASRKQYQLQRLLLDENLDIVAVQETKLSDDESIARLVKPFLPAHDVCVSHAVGVSAGCLLFLKKSIRLSELSIVSDECGRLVVCDFLMYDVQWCVICIYAPNQVNERLAFFRHVEQYLTNDKMIVLLGDFNCVCKPSDRSNELVRPDKSAQFLSEMTERFDLEDVATVQQKQQAFRFTHFQRSAHAKLDRIYISVELAGSLSNYNVKPVFFSDHCLVAVTIG